MRHSVLIAVVAACLSVGATMADHELSIHCLKTGQGDCTVIVSPANKVMMVDVGRASAAHNAHVCDYVDDTLDIDTIDYLVITHYHQDHIGGVEALFEDTEIFVKELWDRGDSNCTQIYRRYAPLVENIRHTVQDGQVFQLGDTTDTVTVHVVSVNGNGVLFPPFLDADCGDSAYSENDFSVAMVVKFNDFEFYVGGDLSGDDHDDYNDIETSVADEVGEVDVYQVNHHGSLRSTNQEFLCALRPIVSVIPVGKLSSVPPHPDVIERLNRRSQGVYYPADTSTNGAVVIVSDGTDEFTVNGVQYPRYICGDVDNSGSEPHDISDLVYLVDYLYTYGPPPPMIDAADVYDCNKQIAVIDLVSLVDYMFKGGAAPCDSCGCN